MAFNHKKADFWFPNFGFKRSLLSLLKTADRVNLWIVLAAGLNSTNLESLVNYCDSHQKDSCFQS